MNEVIRIEFDRNGVELAALPRLPEPNLPGVSIRPGVLGDYAFIDALQKRHSKAVGFMFEAAIKGHIEKGHVLVAEQREGPRGAGSEGPSDGGGAECFYDSCSPVSSLVPLAPGHSTPVGYLIGVDRYLKRDELGIVYQMNIAPGSQRGLIGANLLKAQFDRSAYGCRLYCCWCAQDLAANKFWEAMWFVPLAFRTGGGRSKTKKDGKFRGRMHIFWQKRIRPRKWDELSGAWVEDDYPYWFPSQTGAGAIGEDRIVLPIPPGTHWSDAKPVVLPEGPTVGGEVKLLEERVSALEKEKKGLKKRGSGEGELRGAKSRQLPGAVKTVASGGLHFGPRAPEVLSASEMDAEKIAAEAKAKRDEAERIEAELKEAKKAARRAKKKFDPVQEAFARELKDRWLEEVAARPGLLAAAPGAAKYEVSRGSTNQANTQPVELIEGEKLKLPDAA